MPIQVAPYLGRRFDARRYNCWHFVADVLSRELGLDIGAGRSPERPTKEGFLRAVAAQRDQFRQIPAPEEPCLVLLWPRAGRDPHIGLWTGGRVLHLRSTGAAYEPLERLLLTHRNPTFHACAPDPRHA